MGSCLCLEATAQALPSDGDDNVRAGSFGMSFTAGAAGRSVLESTAVRPVLKPVGTVKGSDGIMRAEQALGTAVTPWSAKEIRKRIESENTLRLDSVVGYNVDGSKATLQAFAYNSDGLMTYRANSYYNASTGGWDLAEEYGYEWTDDGLILDEWGKAYGMGTRHTYVYNDRGWGIEQIIYQLDADGEWVEESKGEYEYDDNANITAERTYTWDGSQWQPSTKAVSTYDSKNRQTYIEGYSWDGLQWIGSIKHFYEWTDKPNPHPVEDGTSDRFTLSLGYVWNNGIWEPSLMYIQKFDNPDGYITMQETAWWNGKNWGGGGNTGNTTVTYWKYDENNVEIYQDGYLCVKDSAEWIKTFDVNYNWTYDDEGNREGTYDIIFYNYDNDYNLAGQYVEERFEEAYNADNLILWKKYWDCNLATYELEEDSEFKRRYDEKGNITYEIKWNWKDGERKPYTEQTYTYDADGNVIDQVNRNGGNSGIPLGAPATRSMDIEPGDLEGWVNSTHFTYAYENGTRYEKLGYRWKDEQWTTNSGQIVDYDFDHPMESVITPVGWTDPYKIDALHNLFGDGNNGWLESKMLYYWTEHVATGVSEVTAGDVEVSYAGDIITIAATGDVDVKVYNAGGACVKTSSEKTVDMGGQPSGVYIVKVNGYTTKIVK